MGVSWALLALTLFTEPRVTDLTWWASGSLASTIDLRFFPFLAFWCFTSVTTLNWSFIVWAVLTSSVLGEDLAFSARWHCAGHCILGDDCEVWAWKAVTFESYETIASSWASNVLTSSLIWSLDVSSWALMALSKDVQEFIWMALLLRAVESSTESVWWACLTLT